MSEDVTLQSYAEVRNQNSRFMWVEVNVLGSGKEKAYGIFKFAKPKVKK